MESRIQELQTKLEESEESKSRLIEALSQAEDDDTNPKKTPIIVDQSSEALKEAQRNSQKLEASMKEMMEKMESYEKVFETQLQKQIREQEKLMQKKLEEQHSKFEMEKQLMMQEFGSTKDQVQRVAEQLSMTNGKIEETSNQIKSLQTGPNISHSSKTQTEKKEKKDPVIKTQTIEKQPEKNPQEQPPQKTDEDLANQQKIEQEQKRNQNLAEAKKRHADRAFFDQLPQEGTCNIVVD